VLQSGRKSGLRSARMEERIGRAVKSSEALLDDAGQSQRRKFADRRRRVVARRQRIAVKQGDRKDRFGSCCGRRQNVIGSRPGLTPWRQKRGKREPRETADGKATVSGFRCESGGVQARSDTETDWKATGLRRPDHRSDGCGCCRPFDERGEEHETWSALVDCVGDSRGSACQAGIITGDDAARG
jgi:hypothetical protein